MKTCDIKTIFTSRVFIQKAEIAEDPRMVFIEDIKEKASKLEKLFTYFSCKVKSSQSLIQRFKEFDAPDLGNYIDPDTIDKINKSHKAPIFKHGKKPTSNKNAGVSPKSVYSLCVSNLPNNCKRMSLCTCAHSTASHA